MKHLLLFFLILLLTTGCAASAPPAGSVVLTSTTILADITRNIAGGRMPVESLLPAGMDPHAYQPVPQDAVRISDSRVLIVNGAGYEVFLDALLANTAGEATIIDASAGLGPGAADGDILDPHLWLDPNHVIHYVQNIAAGLGKIDPQGAATYEANADTYVAQLQQLDAWIREQVAQIPPGQRMLVTNHRALGYFADRYGFAVVGTLTEGFSSAASPSARQMAALVDQIRSSGAPAIFLDASDNPSLAAQIAAETGVDVVTDLHLESLTDGPPAGTYIDMMRHNVSVMVDALK